MENNKISKQKNEEKIRADLKKEIAKEDAKVYNKEYYAKNKKETC